MGIMSMSNPSNFNNFDRSIKGYFTIVDNEFISATLSLFLILYASQIAPKLPNNVIKMFDNILVKLALFFIVVYVSNKNASLALTVSIAVMATIIIINNKNCVENISEQFISNYSLYDSGSCSLSKLDNNSEHSKINNKFK